MTARLALLTAMLSLAWSTQALADPVSFGSLIISGFLAVGAGGILPTVSAGVIGTIGLTAIGAAVTAGNVALSLMTRPAAINPGAFKQVIRADETSELRGVGRVGRHAGVLAFPNTKSPYIYRLILHLRGEIDFTEEYFLGGREAVVHESGAVLTPPYGRPPTYDDDGEITGEISTRITLLEKTGADTDTAWPELKAAFPTLWTDDHVIPGIAQTLMIIRAPSLIDDPLDYQKLFSSGPEIELQTTKRAERYYDPRLDDTAAGTGDQRADDPATWGWGDNGILGAAHVHRALNVLSGARYDWTLIAAQATLADATVTVPGGTEKRSRISGVWQSEGRRDDVMADVLASVGAVRRVTAEGKYWFQLVDDMPAAEIAFTALDVYRLGLEPGPKAIERPNMLRVKYYAAEREYKLAEVPLHDFDVDLGEYLYPWARYQDEIDAYGEKPFDLELPFCPSAYQAQRIARLKFEMERADRGEITTDMSGWAAWGCHTGDVEIDGAATRCRLEAPRTTETEGRLAIPFRVIPALEAFEPRPDSSSLDFSHRGNSGYLALLMDD